MITRDVRDIERIVPRSWVERFGDPPADPRDRAEWLARAIDSGLETRVVLDDPDAPATFYRSTASAPASLLAPTTKTQAKVPTVHGLGLPYGRLSEDLGGFVEQFASHALRDQEQGRFSGVELRYSHVRENVLASTRAETMVVSSTPAGLFFTAEPNPHGVGEYVMAAVQRGDITGASVGGRLREVQWGKLKDGTPLATVVSALLREISLTSQPAYPQTLGTVSLEMPEGATRTTTDAPGISVFDARRQARRIEAQIEAYQRKQREQARAHIAIARVRQDLYAKKLDWAA